jgi:type I restriction enzyme M protein
MLDNETKRRIDTARNILVGRIPDPKAQVEQITIALIYKFMDDMDAEAEELGGKRKFFSGKFARYGWKKLMSLKLGGLNVISLYTDAIQQMNLNPNIPQLFRDIFKNAYLPYRDPETLKSFLKIINEFEYDHSERLGDAFEYLLLVLGSQGDAGQFRTPRHIIDFMVYVVDPKKNETILDPACGTAGFLISSYKHIVKNNSSSYKKKDETFSFGNGNGEFYKGDKLTPDDRKKLAANIKGFDISPDMVRLSLVNLYLHGFTNPKIYEYDTLTSEERWNESADIIMANPPFMSPKGGIKPHKRFSVESNRSEVLFVDYIAEHLTPKGRAAVIVPEGIIFQSGKSYKALRKMLVEKYLYSVVSLPAGIFNPYSGVKTSILLMDKTLAKKTDKILFAKVENDGFDLGAQRRANTKGELPDIAMAIKKYIESVSKGTEYNVEDYTNLVITTKEKIAENDDWNLSGDRYKTIILNSSTYKQVVLGELLDTSSGGTPLKKEESFFTNGTIPWIKSGEVAQGFIYKAEECITEEGLKYSSAKIFPRDTVLVAMYGATVGQVGILKIEASTNQAVCGIYPNENVLPEYLYNILKYKRQYLISLSSGGAQPNISQKIIRELIIPLPSLEVQKEIVAEIEGWQKIIDGARQVVEYYKPQIDIDPKWPIVKLGEVFKIKSGGTPSRTIQKYWGGKIPWYSSGELNSVYTLESKEMITTAGLENSNATIFPKGSLLVGMYDTAAFKMAIIDRDAAFNQAICGIKPTPTFNLYFLYLYFLSKRDEYLTQRMGVRQRNLSKGFIEELEVPIPEITTQNAIVNEIEKEYELISKNTELVEIFEQKIKAKIAKVWGE